MTGPITAQVDVDLSPAAAFDLFTTEIGLWWRRDTPLDSGTRVTLTHEGFDGLPEQYQRYRDGYAGGWPVILAWFGAHTRHKHHSS